jgi:hypothetical protein
MAGKFKRQVIICPIRKREVEVTYTVSGNWLASDYKVVACPAMYERKIRCDRRCIPLLARPSSFENLVSSRI